MRKITIILSPKLHYFLKFGFTTFTSHLTQMAIEYRSVFKLSQKIECLIKGNAEFFGKLFLNRMKIGFKLALQMDSFEEMISKALKSIQIRRNLANSFKNLKEQAKFYLFWKVERRELVGGRGGGGRREEEPIYLSIYFLQSENMVVVTPDSEEIEELYFQFRKEDKYFPPLPPPSPSHSVSPLPTSFSSPSLPPLPLSSRPLPSVAPPSMIQLLKQRLANIVLLPASLRHLKRKLIIYPNAYLESSLKIQAYFYSKLYFRKFRFKQRGGEREEGRRRREIGVGKVEEGKKIEEGRRREGEGREEGRRREGGKEEGKRSEGGGMEESWRECLVFIHKKGLKFSVVLKELPHYHVKIVELSDYFGIMAGLKSRIGQIEREILPLIKWEEGKGWNLMEKEEKKDEGGGKKESGRREKRDFSGGSRKDKKKEGTGGKSEEGQGKEKGRRENFDISQPIWKRYLEGVVSLLTLELTTCIDFNSRKIIVKGGGFFYKVSWPQELKEKHRSGEEEGKQKMNNLEGRMKKERRRRQKEKVGEAGEEMKKDEGRSREEEVGGRSLGSNRNEGEEERMEKERNKKKYDVKRIREGEEERMEEEEGKTTDEVGGRVLNEEEIRREEDVRWVKEMREHLESVLEGIFVSVDEGKLRVLNDKDSFGPVIFKEKIIKKDGMDLDSIIRVVDGKGKVIVGIETILTKSRSK